MPISLVICIGVVVIAGILVFYKNEELLLKFFLFSIVAYVVIFFKNIISIYKIYK